MEGLGSVRRKEGEESKERTVGRAGALPTTDQREGGGRSGERGGEESRERAALENIGDIDLLHFQ